MALIDDPSVDDSSTPSAPSIPTPAAVPANVPDPQFVPLQGQQPAVDDVYLQQGEGYPLGFKNHFLAVAQEVGRHMLAYNPFSDTNFTQGVLYRAVNDSLMTPEELQAQAKDTQEKLAAIEYVKQNTGLGAFGGTTLGLSMGIAGGLADPTQYLLGSLVGLGMRTAGSVTTGAVSNFLIRDSIKRELTANLIGNLASEVPYQQVGKKEGEQETLGQAVLSSFEGAVGVTAGVYGLKAATKFIRNRFLDNAATMKAASDLALGNKIDVTDVSKVADNAAGTVVSAERNPLSIHDRIDAILENRGSTMREVNPLRTADLQDIPTPTAGIYRRQYYNESTVERGKFPASPAAISSEYAGTEGYFFRGNGKEGQHLYSDNYLGENTQLHSSVETVNSYVEKDAGAGIDVAKPKGRIIDGDAGMPDDIAATVKKVANTDASTLSEALSRMHPEEVDRTMRLLSDKGYDWVKVADRNGGDILQATHANADSNFIQRDLAPVKDAGFNPDELGVLEKTSDTPKISDPKSVLDDIVYLKENKDALKSEPLTAPQAAKEVEARVTETKQAVQELKDMNPEREREITSFEEKVSKEIYSAKKEQEIDKALSFCLFGGSK